jgi:hypothetical protein
MLSTHVAKAFRNVKVIGANDFSIMRDGNLVRKIKAAPHGPFQFWFDRSTAIKENFPIEIMHTKESPGIRLVVHDVENTCGPFRGVPRDYESVNTHIDKIAIKLSRQSHSVSVNNEGSASYSLSRNLHQSN